MIKTKIILTIIIQIVLSVLAFPAAFIIMFMFNIDMNSKFISAADGSVGSGFYTYLKICGIILIIIWLSFPLFKLTKYYYKKTKKN
ncbi:hypothetical protein GCM10022257_15670 [Hyunsoonleella aestuarii]|uniref:Uncharacterized protein n=1 Tax=Hyunsoonleella aestuarii TaxID=912802 RepID=A0ABP8EB46_9FLAO